MPPKIPAKNTIQDPDDFQKALEEHELLASGDVPDSSHSGWDVDQLIPPEPGHYVPATVPANVRERVYPEPPEPGQEPADTLPVAAVKRPLADQPTSESDDDELQPSSKKTLSAGDFSKIERFGQLRTRQRNLTFKLRKARDEINPNPSKIMRFETQLEQVQEDLKNFVLPAAKSLVSHRTSQAIKKAQETKGGVHRVWSQKDKDWITLSPSVKEHPIRTEIGKTQSNIRSYRYKIDRFPEKYDAPVYHLKIASMQQKVERLISRLKALSAEQWRPVASKDINIDHMIDTYLKDGSPKDDPVPGLDEESSPLSFSDTDDEGPVDTVQQGKRKHWGSSNDKMRWVVNNVLSKDEKDLWDDKHHLASKVSAIKYNLKDSKLSQERRNALEEDLQEKTPVLRELQRKTRGFLSIPRIMQQHPEINIPPEFMPKVNVTTGRERVIDRASGKFANVDLLSPNDPLLKELREAKRVRKNINYKLSKNPTSEIDLKNLESVKSKINSIVTRISDKNETIRAEQLAVGKDLQEISPEDLQSIDIDDTQYAQMPQPAMPSHLEENPTGIQHYDPLDEFYDHGEGFPLEKL